MQLGCTRAHSKKSLMFSTTAGNPLQLTGVSLEVTSATCQPLTGMLRLQVLPLVTGDPIMPSMKLTVRFSFATGEESVHSVETSGVFNRPEEMASMPYRLNEGTAPEVPTLISSTNFVQVG